MRNLVVLLMDSMPARISEALRDTPRLRGDRGVTAVITAMALLVLLGMAAVAIDGSNLYRERGDAQSGADLSAYAAAYESCIGGSDADAIAAGEAQAASNGYPAGEVTIVKDGAGWRSTIDTQIAGSFSRVLDADPLSTGASAVAECQVAVGGNLPVIFAGGQCGSDPTFDMSGNLATFNGDVHTNDNLKIPGNNNDFNGNTTYVSTLTLTGNNNTFGSGPTQVPWMNWPAGLQLDPNDYLPGGPVDGMYPGQYFSYSTNGDVKIDNATPDGVHVLLGDGKFIFDVTGLTATLTLVVIPNTSDKGTIEISKSDLNITAFHDDILFYTEFWKGGTDYPYSPPPYGSPPVCGASAIQMSANTNVFNGLFVAPRGMIEWNGNNHILNGGLAGWNLKFNGENTTINAIPGGGSGGDPVTWLSE